ncbi:MAG: GAP family protein [Gammaproteobacteria bacterium]|nr:GAP family protein [Gammaproteobacteria bacterium]
MNALLAVLTPIALINSVPMLPGGIAGVVASLAANKPYMTASAFIAGKFVPHFAFGLLLVFGLDAAIDQVNDWVQDKWQDPQTLDVLLQLVIGAAMAVFGYRLAGASNHRPDHASTVSMTPVGAFSVAAGLTIIGLPGALLYFAAIDQILRADLMALGMVQALLYYNLIFLFPLMLIVLLRRIFGTRSDPIFAAVARFLKRWGKRLLFFGLLGLGVVLVVDAIGWFLGFPLLPTYLLERATQ